MKKAKANVIQYKYNYGTEYTNIKILTTRRGRSTAEDQKFKDGLPKLYHEELKVSNAKKENLLTMCKKIIIPAIYHPLFQNLKSDKKIRDVLPEKDTQKWLR